jgi:uncharacterized protein
MNADEIRIALEYAEGIPETTLREAVRQAASLAPAVIAVAQRMAGGIIPLPREERLLRFGLHALAAARETSACPAFLALLKLPPLELEWLFGEDRTEAVTRLLLGLFDGDDAAVCAVVADPATDGEVKSALMPVLARLVWEGRASRERVLELLDRFDREALAEVGSLAWLGWQEAILLLGLTDWIERVQHGWDAGRLPWLQRDVDRQDWVEQTHEAAAHQDDPERFVARSIVPTDDPVAETGWSAERASGPGDAPTGDEMAWLELVLWRRVARGTMSLEETDGFLTALAAGPVPVSPAEFLPQIAGGSADLPLFDTPEHDTLAGGLLVRRHAAITATLRQAKRIVPWISEGVGDLAGALWARGYIHGVSSHRTAWQPLSGTQRVAERVLMPIAALTPEMAGKGPVDLTAENRQTIIRALPSLVSATRVYWTDGEAALFGAQPADAQPVGGQPRRALKVGRNERCPCGSGKKYKRCCGALA